ncbi:uncharacterized, partial [Tachysurus ichikawai]
MPKADKEVKVAAARVKAYNDFEGNPGDYDEERVDVTRLVACEFEDSKEG